jgi:hypothetical protein
MNYCNQAVEILRASNDGNRLEPKDLKLVELGVNGYLSELGEAAFATLHAQVLDGSYFELNRWFHGIEHLTRDHEGYLYWKGTHVEHYSFQDCTWERAAACELATHCQQLERIGITVNARSAISADCYGATAGTPWALALRTYYAFFEKGASRVAIFFKQGATDEVFAIECTAAGVVVTQHIGAYEAYHALQGAGFTSQGPSDSFEQTVARLVALKVSPQRLDAEISGIALN